jgi:isoleucyl-tRNA synthetase
VKASFEVHRDYICSEVLATDVQFKPCEGSSWDLNGEMAKIALARVDLR